jgi:tetraacyldisaccharide 4'-kinase
MSGLERWVMRMWYGRGGRWLAPLASVYGAAVALRTHGYAAGWLKSVRVTRPVIVVGNLTVGGTGKTPLVIWIAERLRASGIAVGIVMRGYGRDDRAVRVINAEMDWREIGDEAVLLHRRTGGPVVVGANRVAAARAAIDAGAQVVLSDDGLQHLRLARDCEIIVVDGARGFGNGRLLPAGPLRERTSHLARADALICNGSPSERLAAEPAWVRAKRFLEMRLAPGAVRPVASLAARSVTGADISRSLEEFRGQRVHAVAGIGHPGRFFRLLAAHGVELIERPFPDHHPFRPGELAFDDGLPVLMTEKDAVRCSAWATPSMWYVPVTAQFSVADEARLLSCIKQRIDCDAVAATR